MSRELVGKITLRYVLIGTLLVLVVACKKAPEKLNPPSVEVPESTTDDVAQNETAMPSLFLEKDKVIGLNSDLTYFSTQNEVILFRPSENDFGLLLEDTQDTSWLKVDDQFEALSNRLLSTFEQTDGIQISIVEKPMIGIARQADTLYFDASKQHYGLILATRDIDPMYLPHDANAVVELIKSHYALE